MEVNAVIKSGRFKGKKGYIIQQCGKYYDMRIDSVTRILIDTDIVDVKKGTVIKQEKRNTQKQNEHKNLVKGCDLQDFLVENSVSNSKFAELCGLSNASITLAVRKDYMSEFVSNKVRYGIEKYNGMTKEQQKYYQIPIVIHRFERNELSGHSGDDMRKLIYESGVYINDVAKVMNISDTAIRNKMNYTKNLTKNYWNTFIKALEIVKEQRKNA